MKFNILTLFACLVPLTACTTGIFIPGATFEPGVMPQIEAADQLSTQFAEQVQATVEARATLTYQATGVGATATAQQVATRPAADAAAFSLATAQAQPLYSTVQKLANTGMLGTTS